MWTGGSRGRGGGVTGLSIAPTGRTWGWGCGALGGGPLGGARRGVEHVTPTGPGRARARGTLHVRRAGQGARFADSLDASPPHSSRVPVLRSSGILGPRGRDREHSLLSLLKG